jgi:hypothetical protein
MHRDILRLRYLRSNVARAPLLPLNGFVMRLQVHHLRTLPVAFLLVEGVCGCASSSIPATRPSVAQSSPAASSGHFLGLPDNEVRRIDDRKSVLHGFVTVTEVRQVDYAEYQRCKAGGGIVAEEVRGPFVYFAERMGRDVPFANASAYMFVTGRRKAPLPAGR